MMKKLIIALILLPTGILTAAAQPKTPYGQSDPQAKLVLDAVSKQYKSYKDIKTDFTLKVEGQDGKLEDSKKGTLILKGNAYRINIAGQELICDGKTTWTYSKDNNEVQINDYQPDNGTITPSRLFTDFYDKDFLYHLLANTKENGRVMQNVEMTPLDKSKSFFKVILTIDKAKKQIIRAIIFDKSGNHYVYEIQHFTPNVPVTDQTFTFNPKDHPKVSVVDLR